MTRTLAAGRGTLSSVVSKKQLGESESVVLAMRPHLKALLVPTLVFLVLCAALGVALALVPLGDLQLWLRLAIMLVTLVVVAKWVLWPYVNWLASTYTVTNERILTKHGVFRRHGRAMPLSRINDVAFDRGLIDGMLGCGTLLVSSAGELGQLVLRDVPRVEQVQRTIYELVGAEPVRARAMWSA